MSLYNTVVVFALLLFAGFYFFLGIKVECSECSKTSRTLSFKQLGTVLLISLISLEAAKIYKGNYKSVITDVIFWAMIWYLFSSAPKYFCRTCMKGLPLIEGNIKKRSLFY